MIHNINASPATAIGSYQKTYLFRTLYNEIIFVCEAVL